MCYSEALSKENGNAHLTDSGWVMIGWKVAVKLGKTYMPWYPLAKTQFIVPYSKSPFSSDTHLRLSLLDVFTKPGSGTPDNMRFHYDMRKVMLDSHGFHLANSRNSAVTDTRANPFGAVKLIRLPKINDMRWNGEAELTTEIFYTVEPNKPGVVCRVLVPECMISVNDNGVHHAHAIYMLHPRKKESGKDIERIAAFQKKWMNVVGKPIEPDSAHQMISFFRKNRKRPIRKNTSQDSLVEVK